MKNSIKFYLKATLLYIGLTLGAFLITFPIINHAYGQVTQDGAGDWQIDTSTDNQGESVKPYLILIKSYNPFNDSTLGPMITGRVNTPNCGSYMDIRRIEAEEYVDSLMKKVRKIVNDKYVVTISVFICNSDWYIIYLHGKEKFASRPIYDKVWEVIK